MDTLHWMEFGDYKSIKIPNQIIISCYDCHGVSPQIQIMQSARLKERPQRTPVSYRATAAVYAPTLSAGSTLAASLGVFSSRALAAVIRRHRSRSQLTMGPIS